MSGGQDDASNSIDSSGPFRHGIRWARDYEYELRRLLEACRGNPVLESQLRQRIEDAEDVRDVKAAIAEGGKIPSEQIDSSGGNTIQCPHCMETLEYSPDGDNWCCERCGILWSRERRYKTKGCRLPDVDTQHQQAEENDVEELDLSKPCEVRIGKCTWCPVIGTPMFNESSDCYGCYRKTAFLGNAIQHIWVERDRIRNVRSPQYEPHTMETLLPLANEWVRMKSGSIHSINVITIDGVWIGNSTAGWSYEELEECTWATGPNAGKPVAREVV